MRSAARIHLDDTLNHVGTFGKSSHLRLKHERGARIVHPAPTPRLELIREDAFDVSDDTRVHDGVVFRIHVRPGSECPVGALGHVFRIHPIERSSGDIGWAGEMHQHRQDREDPVLRVTGVNRCLEGLACDAFRSLIDYARFEGDDLMAQAVDFVLADELTHVRFGSEWVREFCKDDPERALRAREFQRETDRRFAFGGRVVAREERLEAGFSEEELAELEEFDGEGPSRETLVRAGELLRDRHQARKRGESVPPL